MKPQTNFFIASNLHGHETEAKFGNLQALLPNAGNPYGLTITNCTDRRGKKLIEFKHKRGDKTIDFRAHAQLLGKRINVTLLDGKDDKTGVLEALERTFKSLFIETKVVKTKHLPEAVEESAVA